MALRWWLGASDGVWRKTNHQNFFFINANSHWQKFNRYHYDTFYMLLPTSCASKWYQWLWIWLSISIRFVGVSVGMSARNNRFQTNYRCITWFHVVIQAQCVNRLYRAINTYSALMSFFFYRTASRAGPRTCKTVPRWLVQVRGVLLSPLSPHAYVVARCWAELPKGRWNPSPPSYNHKVSKFCGNKQSLCLCKNDKPLKCLQWCGRDCECAISTRVFCVMFTNTPYLEYSVIMPQWVETALWRVDWVINILNVEINLDPFC